MKKISKILEKKAKNAALKTMLVTATLGILESCFNNSQSSPDNTDKKTLWVKATDENGNAIKMTAEDFEKKQQEIAEQKKAEAKLKRIEAAGIPTVKKDKEGNVTELLVGIDEKQDGRHDKDTVVIDYTYSNPRYMPVHKEAYSEKMEKYDGNGEFTIVEKRHPAREYDVTPSYVEIGDYNFKRKILTVEKSKDIVIDEQGDTIITKKIDRYDLPDNMVVPLRFGYPLKPLNNAKPQTKAKGQADKGQPVARRGGRNS